MQNEELILTEMNIKTVIKLILNVLLKLHSNKRKKKQRRYHRIHSLHKSIHNFQGSIQHKRHFTGKK